jgi:hypothetical protein
VDDLAGESPATAPAAMQAERYLLYSPQFGLGNQQIALRNAVGWALALNRTLVLPHILGHSGCSNESLCSASAQEVMPHAAAFVTGNTAPLRVVDMDEFVKTGLHPRRLLVLPVKALWTFRMTDHYWDLLGMSWHRERPPLEVPLSAFEAGAVSSAFGACSGHRVLAFRTLFAAGLDLGGAKRTFPNPGLKWLDRVAMPALYRPHPMLGGLAEEIVQSVRSRARADASVARVACVHLRLGDIVEDCKKYEAESEQPDGRKWVISHFRKGYSCYQPRDQLVANLRALQERGRKAGSSTLGIYAAVEDPAALAMPALAPFHMTSQADFRQVVTRAATRLPPGLASVLLDQFVCARSQHLLLNVFSTFSQMMVTRIGLDHANIGWIRSLDANASAALGGIDINYWTSLPV